LSPQEPLVLTQNRVLAALPPDAYARLRAALAHVDIVPEQVVYHADAVIERVFFPLTGAFSEFVVLEDGTTVEVGTTGNEGMVGLTVFLGSSISLGVVEGQIAGTALAIDAAPFRKAATQSPELRGVLARYAQAHLRQVAQSAACNAVHSTEQRVARWLLMTDDRVGGDEFSLTHELLARMLGIRRETVTAAAGRLQRAGLIRYTRGRVTIADRSGLEAAACECYRQVARAYQALLAMPTA
jgi:CRP-like cAMP-binding protein